jgi:DNA adenine methylase
MKIVNSPLRYPGGKTELGPYIEKVIENNNLLGCHIIEPFAGGASISLHLLQSGYASKATIIEFDPLIYAFWYCVFNMNDQLCDLIKDTPITIDTWNTLTPIKEMEIPVSTKLLEMGFAGLFLNRTNFSGIIKAGPIGGKNQDGTYKIDCRFNKQRIINTIRFFSLFSDRVEVKWTNALNYLEEMSRTKTNEKIFFYIDPPYYEKGKSLYRRYFNKEHHIELSKKLISLNSPWLLSYDKCPFITYLYGDTDRNINRQSLFFDYSTGKTKKQKELLISNLEIPPIEGVKKNPFAVSY